METVRNKRPRMVLRTRSGGQSDAASVHAGAVAQCGLSTQDWTFSGGRVRSTSLVPIENSTEGGVHVTPDTLVQRPGLRIRREIVLPSEQNLLALPGTRLPAAIAGALERVHAVRLLGSYPPG